MTNLRDIVISNQTSWIQQICGERISQYNGVSRLDCRVQVFVRPI